MIPELNFDAMKTNEQRQIRNFKTAFKPKTQFKHDTRTQEDTNKAI